MLEVVSLGIIAVSGPLPEMLYPRMSLLRCRGNMHSGSVPGLHFTSKSFTLFTPPGKDRIRSGKPKRYEFHDQ